MYNKLRTVALDHTSGSLLTEHVHKIRSAFEGGDGCEVGGARVEDAAPEHRDTSALALPHRVGQLGHDGLHLLQHLGLLRTDG